MTVLTTPYVTAPHLEIGPESGDHVSLRVLRRLHSRPLDHVEAGWLVCPVHVHVGGFSGDVAVALRVEELHRFAGALRAVRDGVRRSAVLESIEEWIDLTVTREADGTLSATGYLSDEPGSGSRLRFRIPGLQVAAIDGWVEACTGAVNHYGASVPA